MGEKTFYQTIVDLYSEQMHNDLVNLGCTKNKTFTLEFPYQHVPEDLMRHFIRGYFDGDGSVHYLMEIYAPVSKKRYRASVRGTYSMMDGIRNYIPSNSIPPIKQDKSGYYLEYGGNNVTFKVMEYLYKGATVYLDRKREVYDHVKDYLRYKEEFIELTKKERIINGN